MPIYEYQCRKNHHRFEVIQKLSDPPLTRCRQCSSKVDKLISASSFVLKGSGFYVNDYVKKNGGSGSDGPSPETKKKDDASKSDKSSKADNSKADKKGSTESKSPSKSESKSSAAA